MSDKPIFYYRPLPTGGFFGPLHHESRDLDTAKRMAWTPLYEHPTQQWKPIETAPKDGEVVLAGFRNDLGDWVECSALYASEAYINLHWEGELDQPEGWYELVQFSLITPTHWRARQPAPELILAEIERLDRAADRPSCPEGSTQQRAT